MEGEIMSMKCTGEWISVKDRLPDDWDDVLLVTRTIKTYGLYNKKKIYYDIYRGCFNGHKWLTTYYHGCEYIHSTNKRYRNEVTTVTHWMPLPEPPEEEGHNG